MGINVPGALAGAPAPGFDEPLEMLRACHERIAAQCETLGKLVAHLAQAGPDEQAQQAAAAVLRYFDVAGKHHHADEEENLFPLLLTSVDGEQAGEARALVADLLGEHATMERAWRELRAALEQIAAGRQAELSPRTVADFAAAYRGHIQTENRRVFPLAERVLSAEQRVALGRAMAERRGVRR
jgi:hemerythrin-like domain-containing protein